MQEYRDGHPGVSFGLFEDAAKWIAQRAAQLALGPQGTPSRHPHLKSGEKIITVDNVIQKATEMFNRCAEKTPNVHLVSSPVAQRL